mmetsp:Transcript_67811/g.196116  ORF Transcript_67811/g.196116 Transcript_67811/m.196116 type:complete len:352 (-) Transcript_67811:410-1465(-)
MTLAQRPASKQSPAWRGQFRSQFKKTKMCRFYPEGTCKFGKDCCFAHDAQELSQAPDLTKTSMCTAFMAGKCPLPSEQCQYAHGDEELRITPAFVAKKLSRRTREATASDASTAHDVGPDSEEKYDLSGSESQSSEVMSETDKTTEPPSSPYRRGSSGNITPLSSTSPTIGSPERKGDLHKPVLSLSEVVEGMAEAGPLHGASDQMSPLGDAGDAWSPSVLGSGPCYLGDGMPLTWMCVAGRAHYRDPLLATVAAKDAATPFPGVLPPSLLSMQDIRGRSVSGDYEDDFSGGESGRAEHMRVVIGSKAPAPEAAKVPMPVSLDELSSNFPAEFEPIILAARWSSLPLRVDL